MEGCPVSLKQNEQKVLKLLTENKDYSFREIAKLVGLNEVSVRRICNKLKLDGVFHTVNIPNFPALGYNVLMMQRIRVSGSHLIETKSIIGNVLKEWPNCIDCHETYDGKIIARSVWRNAEDFKEAHAGFYKKFGTGWLEHEEIDMVPLEGNGAFMRIQDF